MRTAKTLASVLLVLLVPAAAHAQQTTPALPGGASSLQETYQDWHVACSIADTAKICAMSQQQTQQNGQRVLAMELRLNPDGTAAGVLVLPFGLKLDAGATLRIDDKPALPVARFSTCLPGGCLVPVTFNGATVTVLRSGEAIKLSTRRDDNQELGFAVSLKGFSNALDRLKALGGR